MSNSIRATTLVLALLVEGGLAACSSGATLFRLHDWTGASATDALSSLRPVAHDVAITTEDGSDAPSDLTGWVVVDESPRPGSTVDASQTIHLVVALPHAPAQSSSPSAPPVVPVPAATPTPTPAPPPAQPLVQPAPAQPAAPAAPAAPAPPPPPPAPAPVSGAIMPGAFCSDAQVGQVGVAANGRSYTCGGHGADANGHYHWNAM